MDISETDQNISSFHKSSGEIVESSETKGYASIDDILGDGDGRYFSTGYRRTKYILSPARLGDDQLNASVTVVYPRDWSKKKEGVRPPHLSTVDAAYLGVLAAEELLASRFVLPSDGRPARLLWIEMESGREADEVLENLPIVAKIDSDPDHLSKRLTYKTLTRINCKVGRMMIRLGFGHNGVLRNGPEPHFTSPSPMAGTDNAEACRNFFLQSPLNITDVETHPSGEWVTAQVCRPSEREQFSPISPVETVIVAAQLAQAAIYISDNISRENSNNLWMRDFRIECTGSNRTPHKYFGELFTLNKKRIRQRKETWAIYRFQCLLGAAIASYTFAHIVPEG